MRIKSRSCPRLVPSTFSYSQSNYFLNNILLVKLFIEKNTDSGPVIEPVNDGDKIKVDEKYFYFSNQTAKSNFHSIR